MELMMMPQYSSGDSDRSRFNGFAADLHNIDVVRGNSLPLFDNSERDLLAKARRLERFKDDINQSIPVNLIQNLNGSKINPMVNGREKISGERLGGGQFHSPSSMELDQEEMNQMDQVDVIVGLCPDMCPESERAERERKGDLDQYERLDGDRYQTTKFLAIKKYNRTAEREATLIRPMPVLRQTMDYLLSLLDQSFDAKFIGTYNFLWDRMRAIRMDLRMQHFFNLEAITMLEQMIRLHIIAMHEFCKFKQGEGFVEGFDAHLNIEQMNKASVELFQMYNDHRKKGIDIPTEKEFRGYYALLKLDKHPGYKVEPVELSLDLAQMTPDMRQAPEIRFARDVARVCRAGNVVGFFRLARKASYLQICLMHAHFAKLRTQALASFHSGLRHNQGLPVSSVAKWLAMEDEDITSLLEYHGFIIRDFEEQYMVKDSSFLHRNEDYPTRHSKLVQMKRSQKIVDDVVAPIPSMPFNNTSMDFFRGKAANHEVSTDSQHVKLLTTPLSDEEMYDRERIASPRVGIFSPGGNAISPPNFMSSASVELKEEVKQAGIIIPREPSLGEHVSVQAESIPIFVMPIRNIQTMKLGLSHSPPFAEHVSTKAEPIPSCNMPIINDQAMVPGGLCVCHSSVVTTVAEDVVLKDQTPRDVAREEDSSAKYIQKCREEAAKLKIKFAIRSWKRHASEKKMARERKQLAVYTALGYLSIGPPLKKMKYVLGVPDVSELRINDMIIQKSKKYQKSWSRLNVSEVVVGELSRKNPGVKYLCYKIIACCPINLTGKMVMESNWQFHPDAAPWVFSKLMPTANSDSNELLISSPGMSIWRYSGRPDTDPCCLSIVTECGKDSSATGANGVLFLVSATIPWEAQKMKLTTLLSSLPPGSNTPLLVLTPSRSDPSIPNRLGLHEIKSSRISNIHVLSLVGNQPFGAGYSDERLREGLKWLASESSPQPHLRCVKACNLVLSHMPTLINSSSPDYFVAAFNLALDRSLEEVAGVARLNIQHWPCHEIGSLKEFGYEHNMINFPEPGWSSDMRVNEILKMLANCKLPVFEEDISCLAKGARTPEELEYHKLQLEGCLVKYLTRVFAMESASACMEARVILQGGARVALCDSTYHIIPNWARIFRRIFNWRLMGLTHLWVYISHRQDEESLDVEGETPPLSINEPSLDEMIEASRAGFCPRSPERVHPVSPIVWNLDVTECGTLCENCEDGRLVRMEELRESYKNMASKETEKRLDELSRLLEKCRVQQDRAAMALAIYY